MNVDLPHQGEADIQAIEFAVEEHDKYDRVHPYVTSPSDKTLYNLVKKDGNIYIPSGGMEEGKMQRFDKEALAVVVAYKGAQMFLAARTFKPQTSPQQSFALEISSPEKLKVLLAPFDSFAPENRIAIDLRYQEEFAKEKERRSQRERDNATMLRLYDVLAGDCVSDLR